MENASDLDFILTNNGYYDIYYKNGDFAKNYGYDMAILMSLSCDKRATEREIKIPQNRRGWIGNEINGFDDFEYGSKLWFLDQARATQSTLNNARTYTQDALKWMVDNGDVDSIIVNTEYNDDLDLIINIQFVRKDNATVSKSYNLWKNTFINGEI